MYEPHGMRILAAIEDPSVANEGYRYQRFVSQGRHRRRVIRVQLCSLDAAPFSASSISGKHWARQNWHDQTVGTWVDRCRYVGVICPARITTLTCALCDKV